jgi:hypothetical protein
MTKTKQDRNAGLTQLELPGMDRAEPWAQAMAKAMRDAPPEPATRHEVPTLPPALDVPGSTTFALYDWWFATSVVKHETYGYVAHLYEHIADEWRHITYYHGETLMAADKAAKRAAKLILEQGGRPEAEARNAELAHILKVWRETGQYPYADNG